MDVRSAFRGRVCSRTSPDWLGPSEQPDGTLLPWAARGTLFPGLGSCACAKLSESIISSLQASLTPAHTPDWVTASLCYPPTAFMLCAGNRPECVICSQASALPGPAVAYCWGLDCFTSLPWETQGRLTSCAWCERGWGGAGPDAGAVAAESGPLWPSDGSRCLWSCPGHGGYGPSLPETSGCWTEMCIRMFISALFIIYRCRN